MLPNIIDNTIWPNLEWRVESEPVDYDHAVAIMEERVKQIHKGNASGLIWLLEHPALYSAGISAKPKDCFNPNGLPVYHSGRGGQYTYHGPGQRIVYVMVDLKQWQQDVRAFIHHLEQWIIAVLAAYELNAVCYQDKVGVWVKRPSLGEDKIAAIGIRLRKWVSFHGLAINAAPDLTQFQGIVPCGINDPYYGVTSLKALGKPCAFNELDHHLQDQFSKIFSINPHKQAFF